MSRPWLNFSRSSSLGNKTCHEESFSRRAYSPVVRINAAVMEVHRRPIHQQAWPAHRGERYRREELRIVAQSVLGICIGPGEVEHELPSGMRLAEQGQCAEHPAVRILQHQMRGVQPVRGVVQPDCSRPAEEFVAQERRWPRGRHQRIPTGRVNLGDAVEKSRARHPHAWTARGLRCSSASIRSRYLSASRAAMQPVPAEVTACRYT